MTLNPITYKSYCWCFGTTSYRTQNFNMSIEEQLRLLDIFWKKPEYAKQSWINNNVLQAAYYYFLQDNNFVEGDAPRPDKDAREKTSGLVDLGLINEQRRLSVAGTALLQIALDQSFQSDNVFQIDADSYIYLKQLLKTSCIVDRNIVRPYIVLLRILLEPELKGYLTKEEFTYLVPLCISREDTENVVAEIKQIRAGVNTVDKSIMDIILHMDNYSRAKKLFLTHSVTEGLICEIGMNRKSRIYDAPYFKVYMDLLRMFVRKDIKHIQQLLEHINKLKLKTSWIKFLFDTSSKTAIIKDPWGHCNNTNFMHCSNEEEFKSAFFDTMHLLKVRATLHDYYDLNKRYLSTSETLLFEDDHVSLDVIPKQYFTNCIEELYKEAFRSSNKLLQNCEIEDISSALIVSESTIIENLNDEYHTDIHNISEAMSFVEQQRYQRFNTLVDKKFTDRQLLHILDLLDTRNDKELMDCVTDNADAPTIFEYILGVLWYKLSGRKGKILDYLKLSLDTNLLPKTHAGGGEADIVYEYSATDAYPAHCLLLEATLAEKNNQRRMEMEPVSRHLGNRLINNHNEEAYCVFATNYLNPNVISDFRQRKTFIYYDTNDPSKYVEGMKIIPLETKDLRAIISYHKQYPELYVKFDEAYKDDIHLNPYEWWLNCVRNKIIA